MNILEAAGLGVVQGLTEFLPISSSGHLQAAKRIFGSGEVEDLTFDILVHLVTLLVIVIVFRDSFGEALRGIRRRGEERRLLVHVGIAALPGALVGLFLSGPIESLPGQWPWALPACWIFTGIALFSLRNPRRVEPGAVRVSARVALWVGLWQSLALLPGISRSGITIAAALWAGTSREAAARFSFLAGAPLILGAGLVRVAQLIGAESYDGAPVASYAAGGLAAFVSGWFALRLLVRMLRRGRLYVWSYYLFAVGAAFTIWLLVDGAA